MATMDLDCWKGDWDLPSVDSKCLVVMAYAKFAGAPLKLRRTNNPWWSSTGELPVFRSEGKTLHNPMDVITFLKEHNFNADGEIPYKDQMTALAFASLVEQKLLPALLYTWWMDAKNYVEFTRTWYAKALPFPFNFFIPGSIHKSVVRRLESSRGGAHVADDEMETILFKDARECFNLLSARLGDKEFFYGTMPTLTDAIVFGHIAPLFKVPFPSNKLQNHLKGCPNLCAFCTRILHRYFPKEPQDNPKPKPTEKPADPFEDPHKLRNQILSVGFAVVAMVAYAVLSGLIQVEFVSEEDNEEDSTPPELESETFEFDDDDEAS